MAAHVVLQAAAPQTYGAHAVVAPAVQLPLPSHEPAAVCCPPVQLAVPHDAPAATFAHAPAWHEPVMPHTSGVCAMHRLRGSGAPSLAGLHVPLGPVLTSALHAWHAIVHAELQQRPSTQKPVAHWSAAAHGAPPASVGTQVPLGPGFEQYVPVAQSLSAVQAPSQAVALPQSTPLGQGAAAPAGVQLPAASQVRAGVSMLPVHDAGAHCVVAP